MLPPLIFPGTDLTVSRLAFGTAHLGIKQTEREAFSLLNHFLELGGNFIDTARMYSDWVPGETGRSERILGDWLRMHPRVRERLVIGTKGGHYTWSDPAKRQRVTAADIYEDLALSLDALGVSSIDFYWLHRDNPALPVEAIVDFMQPCVRDGRVRYLGVCNWSTDRLSAANTYAARHGLAGFAANQPLFNLAVWNLQPPPDPTLVDVDRAMFDYHRATQLPLIPYSPQAQGFFSHAASKAFAHVADPTTTNRHATPKNLQLAPVVAELARAKQCSINALVLAYTLHQPFPVIPIVGCNNRAQLNDSASAVSVHLTREEIDRLETAAGMPGR